MPRVRSYRDLVVWQRSSDLVIAVFRLVRQIPREERWGLGDQLRRSALSVPSNIAEGHARGTRPEFSRFVSIALGSLAELETQLDILRRLELVPIDALDRLVLEAGEVGRMLTALRTKLNDTAHRR